MKNALKPLSDGEISDLVETINNHDFPPAASLPSVVSMKEVRKKMGNKTKCAECGDYQEFGAISKTPDGVVHQGRCSILQDYLKTLPEPVVNPKDQAIIDRARASQEAVAEANKYISKIANQLVDSGDLSIPAISKEEEERIFKRVMKAMHEPELNGIFLEPSNLDEKIAAAEKVLAFLKRQKEEGLSDALGA